MVNEARVVESQAKIRDMLNWLQVFYEEYDLPDEAKNILEEKLRELSNIIDQAVSG